MNNLQRSEIVIAKILDHLSELGLQEQLLSFSDLELEDDFGEFFFPCIEWLAAEGVIRHDGIGRLLGGRALGHVQNPVLTSFGFKALGTTIAIGERSETLAGAVKKVSTDKQSFAQIGDFLGGLLGGFTKSIGS